MAGGSMLMIIALVIARSFQHTPGYILKAAEIAAMERRTSAAGIIAEQPSRPPLVEAEVH
jgi:hypothetical protein